MFENFIAISMTIAIGIPCVIIVIEMIGDYIPQG